MYCTKCGNFVEESEQFCQKCGSEVQPKVTEELPNPPQPKKQKDGKLFFKRGLFIGLGVLLVIGVLWSIFVSPRLKTQDALLNYINHDMAEIGEIEDKALSSYNSVTGSNYTDDWTMYYELSTTTIPLCSELNEKVVSISPQNEEISDLHSIYRNFAYKYLNAMAMMLEAIEQQDRTKIIEANDLLNDANNLGTQYRQELYRLADKYGIEIE